MPVQTKVYKIKGKLGDYTYYYMKGKHYYRRNTSLNKERLYTDPAYAEARKNFTLFGRAAKLGSVLYWQLSSKQRRDGVMRRLIGELQLQLLQGRGEEKSLQYMQQRYGVGGRKAQHSCPSGVSKLGRVICWATSLPLPTRRERPLSRMGEDIALQNNSP